MGAKALHRSENSFNPFAKIYPTSTTTLIRHRALHAYFLDDDESLASDGGGAAVVARQFVTKR